MGKLEEKQINLDYKWFYESAIVENVLDIKEESDDCDWITTDSGAHICIGGDGKIKKGPAGLKGKNIDDIRKDKSKNEKLKGKTAMVKQQYENVKKTVPKHHTKGLKLITHEGQAKGVGDRQILAEYNRVGKGEKEGQLQYYGFRKNKLENSMGLKNTLTHEVGHHAFTKLSDIDQSIWAAKNGEYAVVLRGEDSPVRRFKQGAPTKYGRMSYEEDFAETYRLYYTDKQNKIDKERLAFFKKYVD